MSLAGIAGLSFTTWFGGELLARLRVGVSDRAHFNAPNALCDDGVVALTKPEAVTV